MLRRIVTVRRLLGHIDPHLTMTFQECGVSELLFCHRFVVFQKFLFLQKLSIGLTFFVCRWLLLAFQREFDFDQGVRLLETLFSHALEFHSDIGTRARQAIRQKLECNTGNFSKKTCQN